MYSSLHSYKIQYKCLEPFCQYTILYPVIKKAVSIIRIRNSSTCMNYKGEYEMKEYTDYGDIYKFCKAVASPIREQIIELLTKTENMNLQDIAKALNVTNGALTTHIRLLHEAGIINIENVNGAKGIQKICSLSNHRYVLNFSHEVEPLMRCHNMDIPIGSYSDYLVTPTCGLTTTENAIGSYDIPIYFDDPNRIYASILWFFTGYVEYSIPNYLNRNQILKELRISQELCSEVPDYHDSWPSDIYFSINNTILGYWTSPTDFVSTRGLYTPNWWKIGSSQYGMLKTLSITEKGSFIDNKKVSEVSLKDLNIAPGKSIKYRISVPADAENVGGCTIFGKDFGNYNQGIHVSFFYENERSIV